MTPRARTLLKRLLVVPPVAAGAVLLALQIAGRGAPEQAEPGERARPVRVIVVQPTEFVPRALGYGYVQPGTVWEAVAEVSGRIVFRHPDLERGRVLPADTTILGVDPTDYELAVARIESNLESVAARLAELDIRAENTRNLLEIEKRALAIAQEDFKRKQALLERGNASQLTVDQAENAVLAQRQKVQDLANQMRLIPAERRVLEADRALRRAELTEAERDLARTEIATPFDVRIAEVAVEVQQFVAVGQKLAAADSIDVAEIEAQFAIDHVRPLVRTGLDIGSLSVEELSVLPRRWGLRPLVRLATQDMVATWEARFDRVSDTVDPKTRTVGLIVAVDEPYRKAIPGQRPPLFKNMYVEVELRAPPRPNRIVVPRAALHFEDGGRPVVFVAGLDDRLERRPVAPGPMQSDFVVIREGLSAGERVVVSDLIPAIDGMLLAPTRDEALAARLMAQAGGTAALR